MKLLNRYENGNYTVTIYDDGTKIRETDADEFISDFPENIDIKISNKCSVGCAFCHENSNPNGKIANFHHEFLSSLRPGTELAIGGGSVYENPDLDYFLIQCKSLGIIANITVNQTELIEYGMAKNLKRQIAEGIVNGVGISYNGNYESMIKLLDELSYKHIVIHVINGVHSYENIMKLSDRGYKILILGYKDVRRGKDFRGIMDDSIKSNQKSIYNGIKNIVRSFDVTSFDNLAIEQLDIKRIMPKEKWDEFFMGDEGSHTMYVDLVEEKFSLNSCATNYRHDLLPTIDEMFSVIRKDSLKFNKEQ